MTNQQFTITVMQDGQYLQQPEHTVAYHKSVHTLPASYSQDPLSAYSLPGAAHRELNMGAIHVSDKYRNNRAENSHQRTRQQERQMRRFKSAGHAQRFLSMHGMIHNIFNLGRHLNSARCFRELRVRAFLDWRDLSQVASKAC